MTDLPKQIDKRVRRELAALDRPWRLVKKRDHYFVQIEDQPMICVANNSSKRNEWQANKTLERIRKSLMLMLHDIDKHGVKDDSGTTGGKDE